ncbi:hypothetical protein Fcan01_28257 [Folsomia candida]|uniref:Uncharacterized protein n=1 Tax=Folsomia candida TaxID=158441 RepID=A0A226CWH7_FOLCA|nr:hypothetical protein Fcan01_28257 [Folsomia candida]
MKIFNSILHFVATFATTFALLCSSGAAVEQPSKNELLTKDIRVKVTDYFVPFINCTTMVFARDRWYPESNLPVHGPIISLVYDTNTSLVTGKTIQEKFSVARRRNKAAHCWATITILPEKAGLSKEKEYFKFVGRPCFIDRTWRSHYFILITGFKHDITLNNWMDLYVFDFLGVIELILVDINQNHSSLLQYKYHNIYYNLSIPLINELREHIRIPTIEMEQSEAWYHVECSQRDCFDSFSQLGKKLSLRGKYFWTVEQLTFENIAKLSDSLDQIADKSKPNTRHVYKNLADAISFHKFLSFVILQDVLIYGFIGKRPYHIFEDMWRLSMFPTGGYAFVIHDVKTYSFVSCFGARLNSTMLDALSSPFDNTSWAYMGISFITVVLVFTSILTRCSSNAILLVIGISLENSVSLSAFEAKFRQKAYSMVGVNTLYAIWTIMVGTVFTNWYKTLFTMEMIIPTVYKSPWTGLLEVEGIRILLPFTFFGGVNFELYNGNYLYGYLIFYYQLLQFSHHIRFNGKQTNDKKIATKLFKWLQPHFGVDDNMNDLTFEMGRLEQPLVIKSLQTCGKVALMDTKENIAEITNFLNDYHQTAMYVKVDGESFFTERRPDVRGWGMPPIRSDYVEKRLKRLISAGIVTHLKAMYKMWRPPKLLGYYANWTGPRVKPVSRLDFSSKVTTRIKLQSIILLHHYQVIAPANASVAQESPLNENFEVTSQYEYLNSRYCGKVIGTKLVVGGKLDVTSRIMNPFGAGSNPNFRCQLGDDDSQLLRRRRLHCMAAAANGPGGGGGPSNDDDKWTLS